MMLLGRDTCASKAHISRSFSPLCREHPIRSIIYILFYIHEFLLLPSKTPVIIFRWQGPKRLGVATACDLYRIMLNINVCTDFELLEVKVPLIFLGMVGFSPRREER